MIAPSTRQEPRSAHGHTRSRRRPWWAHRAPAQHRTQRRTRPGALRGGDRGVRLHRGRRQHRRQGPAGRRRVRRGARRPGADRARGDPLAGAVRRPAAAADRGAAQRHRTGRHLPAGPGHPEQPRGADPTALVDPRGGALRGRDRAAARLPDPAALRLQRGVGGAGAAGGADLLPGGVRLADLDHHRALLHPAGRVRQDPAGDLLRSLPVRAPRRAGVDGASDLALHLAAGPGARAGAAGLGGLHRGPGAGDRPRDVAAVLRHLRGDALRGHRPDQLDRDRSGAGRRGRGDGRLAVAARTRPGRPVAAPARLGRRRAGRQPDRAVALRLRLGRGAGHRARAGPLDPDRFRGQVRLHPRHHRRGARAGRHGGAAAALPAAGLPRLPGRDRAARPVRAAARDRSGHHHRPTGLRGGRRRARPDPADRGDAAVHRAGRFLGGDQLDHRGAAGATQ